MGSASRLKLREQMPDVRFDGLFGEEETFADLAVDEPSATSWSTSISRAVGSWPTSRVAGGVNGMTDPRRLELRRAAAASNLRLWSR